MRYFRLLAALSVLALAACTSTVENAPNPTATEQLLVTHASERAASGLDFKLKPDTKVYLEMNVSSPTPNDTFLVEALKAHLLGHRLILVNTPGESDVQIHVRVLANSIDNFNRIFGLPATTLPNLPTGGSGSSSYAPTTISIPEIAIFSQHERSGIVELSATCVDSKTGRLISAIGNVFAVAKIVNKHLLVGITVGDVLARPDIHAAIIK